MGLQGVFVHGGLPRDASSRFASSLALGGQNSALPLLLKANVRLTVDERPEREAALQLHSTDNNTIVP